MVKWGLPDWLGNRLPAGRERTFKQRERGAINAGRFGFARTADTKGADFGMSGEPGADVVGSVGGVDVDDQMRLCVALDAGHRERGSGRACIWASEDERRIRVPHVPFGALACVAARRFMQS